MCSRRWFGSTTRRGPAELTPARDCRGGGCDRGQRWSTGSAPSARCCWRMHAMPPRPATSECPFPARGLHHRWRRPSVTAVHAQLAGSPRAALRNLAYLHNDLADPTCVVTCCGCREPHGRREARRHAVAAASSGRHPTGCSPIRGHPWRSGVDALSVGLRQPMAARGIGGHASAIPDEAQEPRTPTMKAQALRHQRGRSCRVVTLVCVAAPDDVPTVVERRQVTSSTLVCRRCRITTSRSAMREDEANALIARVRRSIAGRYLPGFASARHRSGAARTVVALAIREPPFPELPETVALVRQSYQLQCAADGMMYQFALCRGPAISASRSTCAVVARKTAPVARLSVQPREVEAFVNGTGRPSGPPGQEHRRRHAGIGALAASHMRHHLRIQKQRGA